MTTTLRYQIQPTRGQRVSSNPPRSRLWPGHNTRKTITAGGTYDDGVYSYKIGDTTVSVTADGSSDAGVIAALKAQHDSLLPAYEQAESSVSGAVLTLDSRTPETTFVLSALTAPEGATLTQADITESSGARLRPGLVVALHDTNPAWIRRLKSGDTANAFFGITQEGPDMETSTGSASDVDGWDPGAMVTLQTHGEIPVICEQAVTNVNASVYVRCVAGAGEEAGACRLDADSGDAVLATNIRWSSTSWVDEDGQIVCMAIISAPAP